MQTNKLKSDACISGVGQRESAVGEAGAPAARCVWAAQAFRSCKKGGEGKEIFLERVQLPCFHKVYAASSFPHVVCSVCVPNTSLIEASQLRLCC